MDISGFNERFNALVKEFLSVDAESRAFIFRGCRGEHLGNEPNNLMSFSQ